MPSCYWRKHTIIISIQNRNVPVMSYFEGNSHSLNHQCMKIELWIQCLIAQYSHAITNSSHQSDMGPLSVRWDKDNKQFNHQPETIRWRYSISIHRWPDASFQKRWPHPLHSSIALNRTISDRRGPPVPLLGWSSTLFVELSGTCVQWCHVRSTGDQGGHIEMLMSPHSGLGQLEGHGGWRHVSHDMDHREERQRVRGKSFRLDQCPPAVYAPLH